MTGGRRAQQRTARARARHKQHTARQQRTRLREQAHKLEEQRDGAEAKAGPGREPRLGERDRDRKQVAAAVAAVAVLLDARAQLGRPAARLERRQQAAGALVADEVREVVVGLGRIVRAQARQRERDAHLVFLFVCFFGGGGV